MPGCFPHPSLVMEIFKRCQTMSHASLFVPGIVCIGERGSVHQDFNFLPFSLEKKSHVTKKSGVKYPCCERLSIVRLFIFYYLLLFLFCFFLLYFLFYFYFAFILLFASFIFSFTVKPL